MPLRVLELKRTPTGYPVAIHLDTARVDAAGAPDPAAVLTLHWPAFRPRAANETQATYRAERDKYEEMVRREARLLAKDAAARLLGATDPAQITALAGEGEEFS